VTFLFVYSTCRRAEWRISAANKQPIYRNQIAMPVAAWRALALIRGRSNPDSITRYTEP